MSVKVERFNGSAGDWDAFASGQQGYTHFHRHAWKGVMERIFGHECIYLAARDDSGALAGVMPLVRVKSLLFGHYLVSMPFLNYGGPIGTGDAIKALAGEGIRLAAEGGVKLLELRSRLELPLDMRVSTRKITVVLDLPPEGPDKLMASFDRKLRGRIRRPQKEGVTMKMGLDQLDAFYAIFSEHMRDLGTPTLPRRFFAELAATFADSMWIGVAYVGDEPASCGAGFRWGGEYEMTWGASLRRFKNYSPNMMLYWTFMEHAMASGVSQFNFGRCTPGSGTHEFKKQWESHDVPLYWYQHAKGEVAHTPSPDEGAYSWGPKMWMKLPLKVANVLGPPIVKGIP